METTTTVEQGAQWGVEHAKEKLAKEGLAAAERGCAILEKVLARDPNATFWTDMGPGVGSAYVSAYRATVEAAKKAQ